MDPPRVTSQDRAWAEELRDAIELDDPERIATLLAGIHERAVACALVRIRMELAEGPVAATSGE